MRELKFRAWDEKTHTFIPYDLQAYHTDTPQLYKKPLQQYTGLTDKNGKEIFEGDIVKAIYYDLIDGKFHKIKGEVAYDTEQFIGYRIGDTRMSATSNFEVIGNIYENKDLLK